MEKLYELIEQFGETNEKVKLLKKTTDELNTEIKEIMSKSETKNVDTEHFTATYSVTKSESFDDERLIKKLKDLGLHRVIKTVEVVDMELLESAIYDGEISGSELADCKTVKETPKLVVKVRKEKNSGKNKN